MADIPDPLAVHFLADRPDLIEAVATLRWREWGDEPGREDRSWWVDVTTREAGREGLPATWVAVDEDGAVAGAVGLGEFDVAERRDRSPWVLGLIVSPERHGRGTGRLLLSRLAEFAAARGYPQVWVATGTPAVGFYRRCGWEETERLPATWGDQLVILTRRL
jgi:GNAT superfamily N-acetyltransferase